MNARTVLGLNARIIDQGRVLSFGITGEPLLMLKADSDDRPSQTKILDSHRWAVDCGYQNAKQPVSEPTSYSSMPT